VELPNENIDEERVRWKINPIQIQALSYIHLNIYAYISWALVAHSCNPSYSGGRDQEDHSSKPSQANNSGNPILKSSSQKYGWWDGSR
jgi:hypothetical protein